MTANDDDDSENLEERMGEIADILVEIDSARGDVATCECVEKTADFDANLDDAICTLTAVLKTLKTLRGGSR